MHVRDKSALIRTKIIATLGPATADPQRLAAVLEAGVDVCRLNFSHGSREDHERSLRAIREWAARHDQPIAVLGDLCGPKIRLNQVTGEAFTLHPGDTVRFVRGDDDCTTDRLTVSYARFVDEVEVGQRVYIDDGLIRLLVVARDADAVTCTCTTGGRVSSRKGVNLPDTTVSTPALTDKDCRDLDWALARDLDYVALSFVRQPEDLARLQGLIATHKSDIGVIVKIEKAEALEHLDDFIARADGVMVARGDLGVEIDVWRVPLIQKDITARCRAAGKPVIVATQMLQSMIASPMPTRAEVSDVANAILDAADAIMLSGETATGKYPDVAVTMMDRVANTTETYQRERRAARLVVRPAGPSGPTSAIASAAVQAALQLDARLVAVWSATGETVRLVAQHRLPMPVVGLTYDERVYRRINLLYGVVPLRVKPLSNPAEMAAVLDARLIERGLASPGDLIVVVTSTRPRTPGETDTTLVHRIVGVEDR
jgi:pyruvate kinase